MSSTIFMDKKNITMLKSTLVLTLSILTFNAHGASFDCSKASTQVEALICQTSVLNDLDSTMANIYRSKVDSTLKELQKNWIKDVRNNAQTVDELTKVYIERVKFLSEYSAVENKNEPNLNASENKPRLSKTEKNSGKLELSDFSEKFITVDGMEYSTQHREFNKPNFILLCTEAIMVDLMNTWKKDAIKNNQVSEFRQLKENVYNGLWNSTADKLESQITNPRMKAMCELMIAGNR
ncbi:hypothetical protein WFQ12_07585 [Yersinia enterocolitica]|nr:hypothetical protein [Yersinia enterocolitica]ELW8197273.1 hypothetical protein [Yersinia enterocolitica]CNK60271.1 Uncharacterized protein conserved in bacteria%2C putative lipoprotein [Yersinia frederiksenii]